MVTVTKVCGRCKKELELNSDNFAIFKRNKDGFASVCKPCKKVYDKAYRIKNAEKIKEQRKSYVEANKELISQNKKRYREENKEKLKGYRLKNKERISLSNKRYWKENKEKQKQAIRVWREKNSDHIKQYREKNKERDREQAKMWYHTERGNKLARSRTNRRRAKIKSLARDLSLEDWEECLEFFKHSCAYCGGKQDILEQEHFIPITKGGAFTKNNIVTACRSCNASKSNKDFREWYTKQFFYSRENENKILSYLGRGMKSD